MLGMYSEGRNNLFAFSSPFCPVRSDELKKAYLWVDNQNLLKPEERGPGFREGICEFYWHTWNPRQRMWVVMVALDLGHEGLAKRLLGKTMKQSAVVWATALTVLTGIVGITMAGHVPALLHQPAEAVEAL